MKESYGSFAFDLYGTLVDILTDEVSDAVWEKMALFLRLKGADAQAELLRDGYFARCAALEGKGAGKGIPGPVEADIMEVWRGLFDALNLRFSVREAEDAALWFRTLAIRRLRLFPGAKETLFALKEHGKRIALLSNAQAVWTRPELKALGLEGLFDAVFLSSEAGVRKPSPAFFARLFDAGFDPADTVMVGNDPICDAKGAQDCGMASLLIRTPQSPKGRYSLPKDCVRIRMLQDALRWAGA